jgi:hypothetical protein
MRSSPGCADTRKPTMTLADDVALAILLGFVWAVLWLFARR